MGTFLKIMGVVAIIWFGLAAVGCAMMMNVISGVSSSSAFHDAKNRSEVTSALQSGDVDLDRLPSDLESASSVTVHLRDGSVHVLRNSSADRAVRAMLAIKVQAASREANYGSRSYSDYASQPHFKPGEPMVNPNPGGGYDD